MLFPRTPTTPSILYGVSSPEDTALIRLPDYVGQSEIVDLMSSTFSGNATVQEIILPKYLRILRENAFSGCTALRCIWIPKTVRDIPEDVFLHCDALETVYYEGSKQMWEKLPFGGIGIVSAPKEWVRNLQKNECRWQGTKRCFGRQFILTASGNPDCSTVQSQTTRASIPCRMLALRFSIHLQSSKISTRFSPERCWRV